MEVDLKKLIVAAVKRYAEDHYSDGGWDYVIESWSDAEILETVGGAMTAQQAIRRVERIVKVLDNRRRDVVAEVF